MNNYDINTRIPNPHDCLIRRIHIENGCLVFTFEDNISCHESIQAIHPGAESLTMRFHLILEPGIDMYELYARKPRFIHDAFTLQKKESLFSLTEGKYSLEYLNHYAGDREIIVHLGSAEYDYMLSVHADSVAFDWIEPEAQ